jgi:hypothetical protein
VATYADEYGDEPIGTLAREVQQWRALIPEVIEQLEQIRNDHATDGYPNVAYVPAFDAILALLREASR